ELLHGIDATEQTPPPMERSAIGGEASPTMRGVGQSATEDDSIRIAVLPFDDLSPDHDNQWFADGMMDELISTLGSLDRVKVPSRSDVLHYRDHRKKSREVANEMGVRYLIEGGVRKAGEKIRINASLTDTLRGEQLWINKFDGSFDDVFAFQESVSKQITQALKLKLTPEEKEKIAEPPTRNAEAYELYLKGKQQQYLVTREGYENALALYEQAAQLDPEFADAYIAIASVCNVYFREYSRDPKWLRKSELNVEHAEAITGETAKTLWIRGEIEWLRGNNSNAERMLLRSIALDADFKNSLSSLGTLYLNGSNYREAAKFFLRALEIQEETILYFNLLLALDALDESDLLKETAARAILTFDRYLFRTTENHNATLHYAFVQFWAGNFTKASNLASKLLESDSLSGQSLYNLGCLYDCLGKPEVSILLFERALECGYREIEQTRNYVFTTKNEECEQAFRKIVARLEAIIEEESKQTEKGLT
ncbi:MAG TPA: tetratricopeptide repeat protein, partial [Candidatus Kapabacteria bacterium]|nr:tetratricopeptide repeat protein [Candidatus Kapabacteria bacterium]